MMSIQFQCIIIKYSVLFYISNLNFMLSHNFSCSQINTIYLSQNCMTSLQNEYILSFHLYADQMHQIRGRNHILLYKQKGKSIEKSFVFGEWKRMLAYIEWIFSFSGSDHNLLQTKTLHDKRIHIWNHQFWPNEQRLE